MIFKEGNAPHMSEYGLIHEKEQVVEKKEGRTSCLVQIQRFASVSSQRTLAWVFT